MTKAIMADFDPKMIEALARAIKDEMLIEPEAWAELVSFEAVAVTALRAIPLSPDALNALWRGEATVVPSEPTRELVLIIAHDEYPADLESGKRLRQKLGLETIPPRVEYEIAAGQYLRLVAASPYARKDEP